MNSEPSLIKDDQFLIKPDHSHNSIHELRQSIKNTIIDNDCHNLVIDLSGFNLIYASQIGILSSVQHFIKYPDGTLEIIVDSQEAKNMIVLLNIANAKIIVSSKHGFAFNIA
jgi:hypothetical protein